MKRYVIGLDFGSLSGRALLVDVTTGEEIAESVLEYSHGVMYTNLPDGTPLPKDSAIQHPQDYLDVLSFTIRDVISRAGISPEQVIGIGIDFTSATILPVDKNLTPLCFQERFFSHPKAYVTMWKDHTAVAQAKLINQACEKRNAPYVSYFGGSCASENGLAKILSILQTDEEVYKEAYRILEAGDWITMLLTGTDKKGFNFASCMEFWMRDLGGYPPPEFMKDLDLRFENVVTEKFGGDTVSYDKCFGTITAQAAKLTGLKEGTPVATPYIDGYAPVPACGIFEPAKLALVVGTSLCHFICAREYFEMTDACSSLPGALYEDLVIYGAGQSSCGDHLQWFIDNCLPASYLSEAESRGISIHQLLREKVQDTAPGSSGLLCLDWFNGNRSVLNDTNLSALIVGLTLHTKPEEIYRALLEGTVFGTKRILDGMEKSGIKIDEIIACGGIARKDGFMMQLFADITNRTIRVCASSQAPALASAMHASVAAGKERGGYDSIREAASVMAHLLDREYIPDPKKHEIYMRLYQEYLILHDAFGSENGVMKRLKEIRTEGKAEIV